MDAESALLAAIAADPHSDTPRLVYADWLDDHADTLPDPDAARVRAEFIRVQCQIKRYEDLSSAEVQGYADLYRRQDALLTNHRRELLGPLAEVLGPHDAVFDRGFVTEVRLDAGAFARHADAIAALRPLPDVTVFDLVAGLDALSAVATRIDLITAAHAQSERRPDPLPLDPEDVWAVFVDSWPWDRLRALNLEGCRIGDDGLRELTGATPGPGVLNFGRLTNLDLSGNEISDDGVRSLVRWPLWPRLTHLVLGGNPLTNDAAEALADAAGRSRLKYLNLRFTAITSKGQSRLLNRFEPIGTKIDLF